MPAPPAPYDSYDPYNLYGPDVEGCGVLDELEEVEDEESMGPAWLCVCVGGNGYSIYFIYVYVVKNFLFSSYESFWYKSRKPVENGLLVESSQ